MIGRFQNRSEWNDISYRGWSQSQFNYHYQNPHYGFHHAGGTYLPLQTSGPTIPTVAPLHQSQPGQYCNICKVKLGGYKNVEPHNNGKKHRRMLKLYEELQREKTSNVNVPNSQKKSVVQPKTVLKSGKNGSLEKNVSFEVTIAKHKNYLQKDTGVTSGVPTEGHEGKLGEKTSSQGHSLKCKIGGAKTGKYIKTNDGIRMPIESTKLDINALSNSVKSPIQIPALAPLPGPVASRMMRPTPVVGSSFKLPYQHASASQVQVLEGKQCQEIQHPTMDASNQPHASGDSYIMASQVFTPLPSAAYCKICEVKLPSYKCVEMHYNGKKHKRMLKLYEELQRSQTSNGKNGCHVKNVSPDASISKHKNYLHKDIGVTSEAPAQGTNRKRRDNSGEQSHGTKTGKYMKTNNGLRSPMEPSKLEVHAPSTCVGSLVQKPVLAPGPVASQLVAPTPAVGSLQFQHISVSQAQVSKGKENHEIQNPSAEMSDQPHALADFNINIKTELMSSVSAAIVMASPKGPMASQIFTPPSPVGSSFEPQIRPVLQTHVLEGKEHNEIQNPNLETNDQPQSISVELHALAGSDIKTETDVVSSDSVTIEIGQPKEITESHIFSLSSVVGSSYKPQIQHVLRTEMLESKVHHEIQNPTVETNDQQQSISVGLHAPAGSDINTQTEDVSSDSVAVATRPASLVFIPAPMVGSSFKPHNQYVKHIETEVQLSKAIADCESQNHTDDKNNQLLSPALMEFKAPSGSSTNTQTAAEQKMDVLTNEPEITQLYQVAVCLKCGDEGFPEALVFCNKCQVYALHRYCLDGPVIFTDDVTWFCEDCEPNETELSEQCTLLPSGTSDSLNSVKDASQATIEPKNCIERVEKNKQKQQNMADKTKVLLSDNHSLSHHQSSQCSNNSEKEKKFECPPVLREEAKASEDSEIVAVPLPIFDPVWRGSLCLRFQSFGTIIRLLAHVSSLACSRVLEETKLFPEMLCMDLLKKSEVWPETFMKCGTNKDSIALYFFPETESDERDYDKLVDDMISLDLAIKAVIENAELLVFSSKLLPIQYQRFQEKYYLWGVFRSKKALIKDE